jgi:hypothetical protein
MGDEVTFEPQSLHGSGQDFQQVGTRMDGDWQIMQGTVQGMGDIFGDDMVGSLIAATYNAAQQIAHEVYTSAAKGFHDIGGGLTTMAGNYKTTEANNVKDVNDIGKAI